jgi:hypothetical protein
MWPNVEPAATVMKSVLPHLLLVPMNPFLLVVEGAALVAICGVGGAVSRC